MRSAVRVVHGISSWALGIAFPIRFGNYCPDRDRRIHPGAGGVRAKSLQVKTAEISTTGAAEAVFTVSDVLRASITRAGDITYCGNPATVEKRITGAGSVHHKD